MMPKHLYIIGNGFDLHHRINCSYKDFRKWVYENDFAVFEKVDEIYGVYDDDWWSDFENQLASLDAIQYSSKIAFENQPNLLSEHCDRTWNDAEIEVENQLKNLYSNLRECFHKWILQLNPPLESRKIDLGIKDSVFLNFNYTKTLEVLYGINQHCILHIHGCVDDGENFVLGHSKSYGDLVSMNSIRMPEPPNDLSADELSDFYEEHANDGQMLHEQLAMDAAINGIASQRKPVEEIIRKNEIFFRSLSDVSYVHVYGLSLSEVDIPYIRHVLAIAKFAEWEFSSYCPSDDLRITNFCKDNRIVKYSVIDLMDLIGVKQLKIPFSDS